MTHIKICGCMRVADAVAAAEAGADFIGIMFADSRRRVSPEEASQIVRAVGTPLREMEQDEPPPLHPGRFETVDAWFEHGAEALDRLLARKRPLVVGVFKDQDPEEVNEIAAETGIDLMQLSGSEPWSDCLLVNRPAIKVLRPQPGASAGEILAYVEPGAAIAFMLDPSRGTGTAGDWPTANAIAEQLPVWLAGGLTPQNVARAIREVRPWAVDVSSGVETDGAKDAAKIAAFVRAAREADASERPSRSPSMRFAPRKDRSSDLSASPVRPPVGTRHTTYSRRRSSPRASNFDYTGGHAYHVVFLTNRRIRHFSDETWARAATEELLAASTHTGFSLAAYCVMPDHIHTLLEGDAELGSDLRRFAHRFKQALGFKFTQSTARTLWHRSYYDHVVRPDEPLEAHAAYILGNPVRAGLVDTSDAWPFSGPPGMLAAAKQTDRSEDLSLRLVGARLHESFEGMPAP